MEEQKFDTFDTPNQFQYSAVDMDELGATEYTLVNILADNTPSIEEFVPDLEKSIVSVIDSCRKHPRSENILIRVALFDSRNGIKEIHGFSPLSSIDTDNYKLHPAGMTNLNDATFDSIETVKDYAERLINGNTVDNLNTVFFVITDGMENDSKTILNVSKIKDMMTQIRQSKDLESTMSILIGVNDSQCSADLKEFKKEAGFSYYKEMGDATPDALAALGCFTSQLIGSTSIVLGSGKSASLNI